MKFTKLNEEEYSKHDSSKIAGIDEDVPALNDINHFSAWFTNGAFFKELLKEF